MKGLETSGYWEVYNDNGNYLLKGQEHNGAEPVRKYSWVNFSLKCRMKIINDGLVINYRIYNDQQYFVRFGEDGMSLKKSSPNQPAFNLIVHDENYITTKGYLINYCSISNDHIVNY